MRDIEETSLAINHSNIEYLWVFICNKDNLDKLSNDYSNNGYVHIPDYIDINEYNRLFGLTIKENSLTVHGRAWEATKQFINTANKYYNINILNFDFESFIKFLNQYVKEFSSIKDYSKINAYAWGLRSLNRKKLALNGLIKNLSIINKHINH